MASGKVFSKPCEYDGIKFASETERDYYINLHKIKDQGLIKDFEKCSESFVIMDGFKSFRGRMEDPIHYTPDYNITLNSGEIIRLDAKGSGVTTERDARIRQKMFMKAYPNEKLYFIAPLRKYMGEAWVDVAKGHDFSSKLKARYVKRFGPFKKSRVAYEPDRWHEDFEYIDFHGLFYMHVKTKRLKVQKK